MSSTDIIVSSNSDSGAGSLRAALLKSQAKEGGNFNIIFRSSKKPTNNLSTGYFTIPLESPLPNIFRNNVNINVDQPRSVILLPKQSSGGQQLGAGKMNKSGPGGVNGSMLYVGDTNYLFKTSRQYTGKNQPEVHINNVDFVRNQAQGGASSGGGGGGYGAAGAITLTSGELTITNSVFQDLKAKGGASSTGVKGGRGTEFRGVGIKAGSNGSRGGSGGLPSIPLRTGDTGVLAFNNSLKALAPKGGNGGARGGNDTNGFDKHFKNPGKKGSQGQNASSFGFGGGGGGGGGGAGSSAQGFDTKVYSGGEGGKGGNLLGKSFTKNWNISTLEKRPINGPGVGIGAPLDKKENVYVFGGQGGKGGFGGGRNQGGKSGTAGRSGANGPSAIGVWDVPAKDLSGKAISANLFLKDVFFKQNPEELILLSFKNNIFGENVKFGSNKASAKTATFKPLSKTTSPALAPIKTATSSPRVPLVADTSGTTLKGSGLADVFHVNFEDRSTVVGITTDTTDPNNPFNKIWQKLVPDQEDEINAQYQADANVGYLEAMFTGERLEDFLKTLSKDIVATGFKAATKSINPLGFGAKTVSDTFVNFAWDSAAYIQNKAEGTYERERDEKLAANAEIQQELLEDLTEQSQGSFAAVDVGLERTSVVIEDFELGKDIVYLPAGFNKETLIARAGKRTKGGDISSGRNSSGIDIVQLSYETGSNQPQTILTLELNKGTINALRNADQTSTTSAVNAMLRPPTGGSGGRWLLGTKVAEAAVVTSTSFKGGPGGESLLVDRLAGSKLPLDRKIVIETSLGRDVVFGSDGVEEIFTGANDDIIYPGFAPLKKPDTINGGSGSDLVSYIGRAGGDSASAKETPKAEPVDISATGKNSLIVKRRGDSEPIIATLNNVENFQAYGSSSIDLSKAVSDNANDSNEVVVGAGGTILGNDQKQAILISYADDFNDDTKTAYQTTTVINGKGQEDTLKIDFSNQPKDIDEIVQVSLLNDAIGFIRGSAPVVIDNQSSRSFEQQLADRLLIEAANIETITLTTKSGETITQDTAKLQLPILETIAGVDEKSTKETDKKPAGQTDEKPADQTDEKPAIPTDSKTDKPQKIVGTDGNDRLIAKTRGDTLIGGAGKDKLIGVTSEDSSLTRDDDGGFIRSHFFDGPGNDLIEPKAGINYIVVGSGRNTIKMPELDELGGRVNLIRFTSGKDKVINYSSTRDVLAFDGIQTVSVSPSKKKKKAIKGGHNIIIRKNKISYLNDEAKKFLTVKFKDPIDFDPLVSTSPLMGADRIGPIPFDLF